MDSRVKFDPAIAAHRRRFFLDRAFRRPTRGSGSNLARLMDRPRENDAKMPLLDGIPYMLVGGYATASYAPERYTQDVDMVVLPADIARIEDRLRNDGWQRSSELTFPDSTLGLFGASFSKTCEMDLDVISSNDRWLEAAFAATPVINRFGKRVIPLPYLVLMKTDSARAIDQADLSRMLGRVDQDKVEEIVSEIERLYGPSLSEDLRQYAEIGRWEYQDTFDRSPDDEHTDDRSGGR